MPSNRNKRQRKIKPKTIPENLRSYFETGDVDTELFFFDKEKIKAEWVRCRQDILADWIKEHPCSRPWAWWEHESPEIRKRLAGIGDPAWEHLSYAPSYRYGLPDIWITKFDEAYYNGRARDIHGNIIQTSYKGGDFQGRAIDPEDPPLYESQAAYLKRLDLLTPTEKTYLKKHPELMEPEKIEFEDE